MKIIILLTALLCTSVSYSQEKQNIIKIKNPSFEGRPSKGTAPVRWTDVGSIYFKGESPVDIQPGSWGVELKASDGKSYVGLVVRDVETFEAIGQKLSQPLEANKSYSFKLDIAKSKDYTSMSQITGDDASYTGPTFLRINATDKDWQNRRPLADSPVVEHDDWKTYEFILSPSAEVKYLLLEVYFTDPKNPYNGHLLIDNASNIEEIKN